MIMKQEQQQEMAVSPLIQQKASLYGIGSVLMGIRQTANKKAVKKAVKKLRKDVVSELGREGGNDILKANAEAVDNAITGIRHFPNNSKQDRDRLISIAVEDLQKSFNIGMEKLKGGKQA